MYLTEDQKKDIKYEFIHGYHDPYCCIESVNYVLNKLGYHDYMEPTEDYCNIEWRTR